MFGNFPDFHIFYDSARCWLNGIDPYTCGFYYPFSTLFIILPFALLPYNIASYLWLFINLSILVVCLKRQVLWYVLFIPVLQVLINGQIDLIFLPFILHPSGIGIALLTLKPQLILFYLPFWWLWTSSQERKRFILTLAIIYGLSFLIWPTWIFHWQGRPFNQAAYASSSLWGMDILPSYEVVIIGLTLVGIALIFARSMTWVAIQSLMPIQLPYDLVILLRWRVWWIVPVSWLAQVAANWLGASFPHVFLYILIVGYRAVVKPKARNIDISMV